LFDHCKGHNWLFISLPFNSQHQNSDIPTVSTNRIEQLTLGIIGVTPSESRIFWSRIRGNCDHFQNLFWKESKYIDIKFEYGISTHQINDHNYFIIFNFFFYLFLNVCLIIYKLYFANFSQHFFSIIICTKISDVIFTIKYMVIVFLLWNASELISTVSNINFIMIVFTCWKVSKHIYVVIKSNLVSINTCGEWFQFLLWYCIMLGIDKFTSILTVVPEWF
jgi:hypothetical protein